MPYVNRYHGDMSAAWRQEASADERNALKGKRLVGLEIEHEVAYGVNRADLIRQLDEINDTLRDKFIMEKDGSLDDDRGVEIVLPPLPYRSILSSKSLAKRILDKAKEVGADESKTGVGMHVNLNVEGLSREQIGGAVASFHHLKPLSIAIAGRHDSHWAPYLSRETIEEYYNLGTKFAAAWFRRKRPVIEVRANRSAVDWNVAKDRVRYCMEVLHFAEHNPAMITELVMGFYHKKAPSEAELAKGYEEFKQRYIAAHYLPDEIPDYDAYIRVYRPAMERRNGGDPKALGPNGNPALVREFGKWCERQKSKSLQSVVERIRGALNHAIPAAA
jgi:hypothetical protein